MPFGTPLLTSRTNDAGALQNYQQALKIDLELAQDKSNTQAQRDIAIDYSDIGDVLSNHLSSQGDLASALQFYQQAQEIYLELAQDKSNAQAQIDLAVKYRNMGDVLSSQGKLAGALQNYQQCLAIDLELAKDKSYAQAQSELAVDYEQIGNILRQMGDRADAKEDIQKSEAILQQLQNEGQQ
jgi:tetratricopeptide (TPR) repeat protein